MSEEKEEKSGGKVSPLAWLVVIGIVVAVAWKFGAFQSFVSTGGKATIADGQATATLAKSGDICVQGLPAAESLTCSGCSMPGKFSDAGPGEIFSCRGGRVAYATDVLPGRAVQISLAGGKPPVNFTFTEFDALVKLGPAEAASTATASASPTLQPGSQATPSSTTTGGQLEGLSQTAPQVVRRADAPAPVSRRQAAPEDGYQSADPPAVSAQPAPEPVQWLSVWVELCQNNRPGRDACKMVPAQAVGYWYCVADADLPGYARIDYMKAGSSRYDRLEQAGGFTCGGVRSP